MTAGMTIEWMHAEKFGKREPAPGYSILVTKSSLATLSLEMARLLKDTRITWGTEDGLIVARTSALGDFGVWRRQVSARPLRRLGVEPGTRIHFRGQPERGIIIETRREGSIPRHVSGIQSGA